MAMHPRLNLWMDLGKLLADAAEAGAARAQNEMVRVRRRHRSYRTLRPGADTPLWNACAGLLREELAPHGAKARLARHLGIPRQRVGDFLKNGSRMPDAETLLAMLGWLAEKRAGRDVSL
jgi:hypothetical protein